MSDKNKLHYYFKKSSKSPLKSPGAPVVTAQDADTIDTAKLIEQNESDNTSSSSTSLSQSSSTSFECEIHDNKNLNDNDIDEPAERRKRKIPLRFGGSEINPNVVTVQDEYRVVSFYALIDNIVKSIQERFDENYLSIVILCEKLFLTKTLLPEDDLKQIARFYNISYDDLRAEQRLYKTALVVAMNILLKILWTIPVNVCGCERSFSSLRRIKTYLRNTTGQERLSSLALINIEKDYQIDIDAVTTDFVSKKDERKRIF